MIKNIKSKFDSETKRKTKNLVNKIKAFFVFNNLTTLAKIFGTDKWGYHYYTKHYQKHFRPFKYKKIKLLEIGVGGYHIPTNGGNSLRMWKAYFCLGKIYSLDIYDKSPHEEHRIKIYQGSQVDQKFLMSICEEIGDLDIIIDDGSHINEHVIKTFEYLFPKLKNGGIYVIEDTQTSYWKEYGGTSENFNQDGTIYFYFKRLIDALNNEEFMIDGYEKKYYDKHIVSMHFYHNMIFIYKGENNEPSTYLKNNQIKNE